jgi:hypothetical protein
MSEQAAMTPRCAECGEVWLPRDEERWRAYIAGEDEVAVYC